LVHKLPTEIVDPVEAARNARRGLILFAVYGLLYLTFVVLNAFAPPVMETVVFAGINLAVLYGLGLIAAAFLLALVYAWLCRSRARS
jgi:uncharacterized membrane protein (DUF485 family)